MQSTGLVRHGDHVAITRAQARKQTRSAPKTLRKTATPKMKKGGTVKDACYRKVKKQYKVFPSAYASGAIAKCRKAKAKGKK